jgi:hypothetical protein
MFNYTETNKELLEKFNNVLNPKNSPIYGVAYNHQRNFFYKRQDFIKKNLKLSEAMDSSKEIFETVAIEIKYLEDMGFISIDIDNPFITFLVYANNLNFLISTPRYLHSNIILKLDEHCDIDFLKLNDVTPTSKIEVLSKFFMPDAKSTHRYFITLGEEISNFSSFKKIIEYYDQEFKKLNINMFDLYFEDISKHKIL